MFDKILVPFDGSKLAARVFPQVAELAKTCKSHVTLIHVCHTEKEWEGTPEMVAQAPAKAHKACESFLSTAGNELREQGVEVDWICADGVPAREIIHYADTNKMDLIVMATHGRSEVAWVMGSVAERVVTHATVPVLLLRVIEARPPLLKEEYFR